jgi:hypothetical protein
MVASRMGDSGRDGLSSRCVMNREAVNKRAVDEACGRRPIPSRTRLHPHHGLGLVEST